MKLREKINKNLRNSLNTNENKKIRVTFPSYMGDESRMMTVQELEKEYKGYLILDPNAGEQVDMERLANLEEVIVLPPIAGG